MLKHEKKKIVLNNDFDLPAIPSLPEPEIKEHAPEITQEIKKPLPSKKSVIRFNHERTAVVKIGFDLPEDVDYDIEIIATKERKTKKDLLTEIVTDWLKKNKHKKD